MFDEPEKFVAGLKKLGFSTVQEVAAATARITEEQMEYMEEHRNLKYMITASCPSVYLYICKYYPESVSYTHLDVYKRQVYRPAQYNGFCNNVPSI